VLVLLAGLGRFERTAIFPGPQGSKGRRDLIKTLHGYLARDLAKVTCLALAAFTLIMTVFAIIEPLRKEGLGAAQALELISYTLPMMMSLTLPVAALFAATIVYGRFSQDRELMACRASGISTLALLKPALVLGGIVTAASLALGSFVTPQMVRLIKTTVKADLRAITYRRLRTKGYLHHEDLIIHADNVNEPKDEILGVVVAYTKDPQNVRLVAAPRVRLNFAERGGETYVTFDLRDAVVTSTGEYTMYRLSSHPPETRKLESLAKEEPSWYDWGKLLRSLKNPEENRQISQKFRQIKKLLCLDMLARAVASSIEAGEAYAGLRDEQQSYQVWAGRARPTGEGEVLLEADRRNGRFRPVEVTVFREGRPYQIVTAKSGRITAGYSELSGATLVSIELLDDVSVISLAERSARPQHRSRWVVGQLFLPDELRRRAESVPLKHIVTRAGELTRDPKLLRKIRGLRDDAIRKLINKIKAEMHMRTAYGVSCFLMVAMGAALGLVLRGGQVVSAFAITVVPAALVIVMMIMGKQMVSNKDVPAYLGLTAIWTGVAALLAADVVIYALLRRR